jgi:hypothetical protein
MLDLPFFSNNLSKVFSLWSSLVFLFTLSSLMDSCQSLKSVPLFDGKTFQVGRAIRLRPGTFKMVQLSGVRSSKQSRIMNSW